MGGGDSEGWEYFVYGEMEKGICSLRTVRGSWEDKTGIWRRVPAIWREGGEAVGGQAPFCRLWRGGGDGGRKGGTTGRCPFTLLTPLNTSPIMPSQLPLYRFPYLPSRTMWMSYQQPTRRHISFRMSTAMPSYICWSLTADVNGAACNVITTTRHYIAATKPGLTQPERVTAS